MSMCSSFLNGKTPFQSEPIQKIGKAHFIWYNNKMQFSRINIISLGCPKSLVESEYIGGLLSSSGYKITDNLKESDIVIINTCAFIQDAVRESIDVILDVARAKEEGNIKKIVVIGCLVQRYGYKLKREIPEVDIWVGTGKFHQILDILNNGKSFYISKPEHIQKDLFPRIQGTPFYTSYLRVSDGCSHNCSFCLIPKLRGPLRSVPPEILIREAEWLAKKGVKEINLVAQDITSYGRDLQEDINLESLIEAILRIKEISWIRLLYLHPSGISENLLKLIENEEKICPYLDIPIQHINDNILNRMWRGYDKKFIMELIERIKKLRRKIYLRSTLIVGFPGEDEEIFNELCDFVRQVEFDHLGVFVFSPEEGTHARRYKDQVKEEVAKERYDVIMSIQAEISNRKNRQIIGKKIPVLIEGFHPETDLLLVGRSSGMAPEIDGRVIINKGYGNIGEIRDVLITDAYTYDLVGEIL